MNKRPHSTATGLPPALAPQIRSYARGKGFLFFLARERARALGEYLVHAARFN